jgi:hypothetical protein
VSICPHCKSRDIAWLDHCPTCHVKIPIVCPQCSHDDKIQKVIKLYTGYDFYSDSAIALRDFLRQNKPIYRTAQIERLKPPRRPLSEVREMVIIFVILVSGGLLGGFVGVMVGNKEGYNGGVCIGMLASFLILAFISNRQQDKLWHWQDAMWKWSYLYYGFVA